MPAHDRTLDVVREWIAKAENDLKTAVHTLKLGENYLYPARFFVPIQVPEAVERAFSGAA